MCQNGPSVHSSLIPKWPFGAFQHNFNMTPRCLLVMGSLGRGAILSGQYWLFRHQLCLLSFFFSSSKEASKKIQFKVLWLRHSRKIRNFHISFKMLALEFISIKQPRFQVHRILKVTIENQDKTNPHIYTCTLPVLKWVIYISKV